MAEGDPSNRLVAVEIRLGWMRDAGGLHGWGWTVPLDFHRGGASPCGAELAGNVWEWSVDEISDMVIEGSDTDMIVAQPLPLTDLFHDGLSPWEKCAEMAQKHPDRAVFNPLEGKKALDLMEIHALVVRRGQDHLRRRIPDLAPPSRHSRSSGTWSSRGTSSGTTDIPR